VQEWEAWVADRSNQSGTDGALGPANATALADKIATLAAAGLPLARGLVALSEELPDARLRRSMNSLAKDLDDGMPLEQAIDRPDRRVPAHLRGLMVAGLRSGQLSEILSRFSQFIGVRNELTRRFWLSLAYPLLTLLIATGLFLFVSMFLVDQFESIYRAFNVPLPRITVGLIVVGHTLKRSIYPALTIIAILIALWLAARIFLSQPVRRAIAGRLIIVGPTWRAISLAEFCHLLALLLESRLPLSEALRMAGEGVEDADIDRSSRLMAGRVEAGQTLFQSMEKGTLFPTGMRRLVRWAENTQSLPEVLHMAGEMFENRARASASLLSTVLIVACVLMVFVMVMALPSLILPLITLIARLS
jgi:general secretion pathway protein F